MAWEWEKEAKSLQFIARLKHPHIICFITAFRRGQKMDRKHYLMFEWASGGNLRDLWKSENQPVGSSLTAKCVKDTLVQLRGLSWALTTTHYPSTSNLNIPKQNPDEMTNMRHGDIKPENILWFKEEKHNGLGVLKIGDWGLAKDHIVATELRSQKSSTRHGTLRYEAPERVTGLDQNAQSSKTIKISRLYDLWSMGCVIFEYIVWLLYGFDGLSDFQSLDIPSFYHAYEENGIQKARIHPDVDRWMIHMAKDQACRETAIGDLLKIVQKRLLVVKLHPKTASFYDDQITPSPSCSDPRDGNLNHIPSIEVMDEDAKEGSSRQNSSDASDQRPALCCRATAQQLEQELEEIISKGKDNEAYWLKRKAGKPPPPLQKTQQHLTTLHIGESPRIATKGTDAGQTAAGRLAPHNSPWADYTAPDLTDDWKLDIDNSFANDVLCAIRRLQLPVELAAEANQPSVLCSDCKERFVPHIWDNAFSILYETAELQAKEDTCRLCKLFWDECKRAGAENSPRVRLQRDGSSLKINGGSRPALSICKSIGT